MSDRPQAPALDDEVIEIRGAREHNLCDVSLKLPKNQLIVFTGVSGSGKSSLAFDTLYAEGQRRYIESLSSYARQFLGQLQKPDVDYLGGLSPSISIEQKTGAANPRSTVGTITEIYDFLRVLFARVGQGHCPECDRPVAAQSREQIVERILSFPAGQRVMILAPTVRNQKGEFRDYFDDLIKRGYVRARVDGVIVRLSERHALDRQMRHHIDVVMDRLTIDRKNRSRFAEVVEAALSLGEGTLIVAFETDDASAPDKGPAQGELLLSSRYACAECGISFDPPTPQLFSFNSPLGMCPTCDGLGQMHRFNEDLLVPEPDLSFRDGAVKLLGKLSSMPTLQRSVYESVASTFGFSLDIPWRDLPAKARKILLHGTGKQIIKITIRHKGRKAVRRGLFEGVIPLLMRRHKAAKSSMFRQMYEKAMAILPCPDCAGSRLRPQARHVRIAGRTIVELNQLPIDELSSFIDSLMGHLSPVEQTIATEVIKEVRTRLGFLLNVGLHYVSLDRGANTLSGGEAQRIRLASQVGSGLVGVLYVLDEPSIGLHPRDNSRLVATLARLRDQGNTVVVVEHDEETIRAADYLVDFGPGPGVRGGNVVAQGSMSDLMKSELSVTGQFLSGRDSIPIPAVRRPIDRSSQGQFAPPVERPQKPPKKQAQTLTPEAEERAVPKRKKPRTDGTAKS